MISEDPSNMSFEDSMELARQFCDPPVPYWDELRGRLIESLKSLKEEERVNFLLSLPFCKECGRDDAEGVCQCWNDE